MGMNKEMVVNILIYKVVFDDETEEIIFFFDFNYFDFSAD